MGRLSSRATLLDLSNSVRSRLTSGLATFTFDDFPRSAYTVGCRMVEEAGGRATLFASSNFMGQSVDGVEYYDADILKDVDASGHEIGCHTADHVRLSGYGAAYALDSCGRNLLSMRRILGDDFQMSSFAYPYGDVSPSVKWAMGRRFAVCRGVHPGSNAPLADLGQLRVVSLESRLWDEAKVIQNIGDANRKKRWLIFLTHDVSSHPSPYGSTPEMISVVLENLVAHGVPILTLKAASARVAFG